MVGNILVAHGMRKGNQNKALEEFITTLLKDGAIKIQRLLARYT
jgi:sirohydrochlorin ferrochelatase